MRISCEELRKVGVLKIADPVRHAEMAEIRDGDQMTPPQRAERAVGELPVVAVGTRPGEAQRQVVAQCFDVEIHEEVEMLTPALVMIGKRLLRDARATVVDRRATVLDVGAENEVSHRASLAARSIRG